MDLSMTHEISNEENLDLGVHRTTWDFRVHFYKKCIWVGSIKPYEYQIILPLIEFFSHSRHLEISYYVNFLGRLGSNGFQLKRRFGTHGIWKNQNPGGAVLELPAKQHCQFSPFCPFSM